MKFRMTRRLALALVLLFCTGSLHAQQFSPPGERAAALRTRAFATEDLRERSRLLFQSLAEWYEEAARAVLTGDYDRLKEATDGELLTQPLAFGYHHLACPDGTVRLPNPFASYMAYAMGWWDGQGGRRVSNLPGGLANSLLQRAESYRVSPGIFAGPEAVAVGWTAGATGSLYPVAIQCVREAYFGPR